MSKKSQLPNAKTIYFWNLLGNLAASGVSVLYLLIVTRLTSASIADQFSLIWSIGTLWVVIGLFQVRNYHGTDVRQNYICHVGNLVSLPKDSRRKSVYLIYYFNVISDDFIPCLGLYF